MFKKWPLTFGLVAAAMMMLGTTTSAAESEIPQLKLPNAMSSTGTISLVPADPEENSDTDLVTFYRRRFGVSYYRSYSYYPRYYSSFRYSYYPRYYNSFRYSYYPRYYGGYGYARSYSYYPRRSFSFSYGYYPGYSSCYYGISLDPCVNVLIPAYPLTPSDSQLVPKVPQVEEPRPMNPAPEDAPGTFDYDGNPTNPQPVPNADNPTPKPEAQPLPKVPLEGRAVSIPAPKEESPFRFRAYGEKPERTGFAEDRTVLTGNR